ncbi:hypothetical protein [Pseudonocardia sp. 73-21]|uniref:hypothetical protein n=1 Tax=Pseudonocardia sp. 73-21 TaxID=1895809 RepID=UPI00095CFD22|nr:hypothetical protein [Pseudonocardia sp. 73-21]OJY52834.1 MAG: hypothetical protein BGP03_10590 [Pseudonocardia sp. 73-21]
MNPSWVTGLLLAATAANGIAAGATLDQAIKQLPARRRIGAPAYLDYVRAADMGNGLIWYPIMGVGTAALTLTAVVVGLLTHPTTVLAIALVAAGAGTVAGGVTTARAAPTLLPLRHGEHTAEAVEAVLNRFATINALRAAAIVLTLAAAIWALAETTS